MRKIYFLLLSMMPLLSVPILAQQYYPLLEEGKSWHYTNRDYMGENPYQYFCALQGDTLVDGRRYMRYCEENGEVSSLLREDGGKVFVYNMFNKREWLLYDFTLLAGDLFNSDGDGNGLLVASVDTVRVFCSPRKRLHLYNKWRDEYGTDYIDYDLPAVWVEGMGSDRGLLNAYPINPGDYEYLDYIEMPDGRKYDFTQSDDTDPVSEDSYLPILEDGKVWSAMRKFPSGEVEWKREVIGDTVLLDRKCKAVRSTYAGEILYGGDSYYYEEDGRLYLYREYDKRFWLIYDLGITETGWHNEFENHPIYVYDIQRSYMTIEGQERLCVTIDYDMDNERGEFPAREIWVEGIGQISITPLVSFNAYMEAGNGGYFNSCTLNGKAIFTHGDFDKITNIHSAIKESPSDNVQDVYDLQGRRMQKPQRGGLYIKDGKKFIQK